MRQRVGTGGGSRRQFVAMTIRARWRAEWGSDLGRGRLRRGVLSGV